MPKKAKKGSATGGASLAPSSSGDTMSHGAMSTQFEDYGSKLPIDDEIMFDLPETNYKVASLNVDNINSDRSQLNNAKWGTMYRSLLPGMDELVSTASVRQIVKGILKNKNPTAKQIANITRFVDTISSVRLPTGGSGYRFKDGSKSMQHPSGEPVWGSTGENHGKADQVRRRAVLKTMEQHVNAGSSLETTMKAMISRAISHTLNTFTAPVTAKNLETLNKMNDDERMKQVEDREREKERAKKMGAKQRPGNDNSIDRDWEGDDRSDISEDRFLGAEREKKVRLEKKDVPTITNDKGKKKVAKKQAKKTIKPPAATKAKVPKGPSKGANKLKKQSPVQKKLNKQNQQKKNSINRGSTGKRSSQRLKDKR